MIPTEAPLKHRVHLQRAADFADVIRFALKGEATRARHYLETAHPRQRCDEFVRNPVGQALIILRTSADQRQHRYASFKSRGRNLIFRHELGIVTSAPIDDPDRILYAFRTVILLQFLAQAAKLHPHDGVGGGVVTGAASEDLDSENRSLKLVALTCQSLRHSVAKEVPQSRAPRSEERRVGKECRS